MNDFTTPDSQPSIVYRWLGAVPMLMSFAIMANVSIHSSEIVELYNRWRVDLPKPTIAALYVCELLSRFYGVALPFMFVVCWSYFGWASKKRDRIIWFNTFAFLFCILTSLLLIGGLFLPYVKIQEQLRRK